MPRKNKWLPWTGDLLDTIAVYVGSFLMIIGAAGVFLLAFTPWDWLNSIPKGIGMAVATFITLLGGILLQPPDRRSRVMGLLWTPVLTVLRAGRELLDRNVEKTRARKR